jgi:hypothetical protein
MRIVWELHIPDLESAEGDALLEAVFGTSSEPVELKTHTVRWAEKFTGRYANVTSSAKVRASLVRVALSSRALTRAARGVAGSIFRIYRELSYRHEKVE